MITAAALAIAIVFLAFGVSTVFFVKQIAIGMAFGVMIDATIVRALLVPSLMRLLGEWNWWAPKPLRRIYLRLGISEAEPRPARPAASSRSLTAPSAGRCGRLPRVNFVEDVMERSPASRLGIVAVDAEGNRRDWHFGELIARSAGLSGAFAARGVKRGDVVMTLLGNRIEWALALLACWRMGAVALPCSPQLRRHDLEHAGQRRRRRRSASARRSCSASCRTGCRR